MEIEREQTSTSKNKNSVLMFYDGKMLKISNLLASKTTKSKILQLHKLPNFFEQTYLNYSLYITSPAFFCRATLDCSITHLIPSSSIPQHNSLTGYGDSLISTGGVVEGKELRVSELYSLKTSGWKVLPQMLHSAQSHSSVLLQQSVLYCFTVELQVLKLNGCMKYESLQCNTLRKFSMNHLKIVPQNEELLLFGHPETLYGSKLFKFSKEGELLKKQRSTIISEKKFEISNFRGNLYALGQKYLSIWNPKGNKFERLSK